MPEYRAYLIGDDAHFIGWEHLLCADDSEALEKARRLLDQWPVELWSGDRLVARLGKPQGGKDLVTNEVHEG